MWPCENLTDLELDGLKESMNICMGKAASALSEIFGKQVRISIPQVILEPAEQIRGALGAYDRVVAVSISIVGDAKGDLMLFFNKPDSSSLANLLLGDSGDGAMSTLHDLDAATAYELVRRQGMHLGAVEHDRAFGDLAAL